MCQTPVYKVINKPVKHLKVLPTRLLPPRLPATRAEKLLPEERLWLAALQQLDHGQLGQNLATPQGAHAMSPELPTLQVTMPTLN